MQVIANRREPQLASSWAWWVLFGSQGRLCTDYLYIGPSLRSESQSYKTQRSHLLIHLIRFDVRLCHLCCLHEESAGSADHWNRGNSYKLLLSPGSWLCSWSHLTLQNTAPSWKIKHLGNVRKKTEYKEKIYRRLWKTFPRWQRESLQYDELFQCSRTESINHDDRHASNKWSLSGKVSLTEKTCYIATKLYSDIKQVQSVLFSIKLTEMHANDQLLFVFRYFPYGRWLNPFPIYENSA